jgi:hypothetical protein
MFGIKPKDRTFFEMFKSSAENIMDAARILKDATAGKIPLADAAKTIKDIEHKGDKITHETIEILHRTFITPIEREDIHEIICKMDDICDLIDGAIDKMVLYEVKRVQTPAARLSEILERACSEILNVIEKFKSYKRTNEILPFCVLVNEFENEADNVHRAAIADLFKNEKDPIEVIKWKAIYQDIETAVDKCEDVAEIIEGVVIKNN